MKSLLIFLVLAFETLAIDEDFLKQTRMKVRKIAEECVEEERAQMSELDIIMNMEIPQSHEGKCVLFCTHKKFNIQNDDGSINKEGAEETFAIVKDADEDFHTKVVNAFEHCLSTPKVSDPCLYSAELSICFLKKAKEEGIHELVIE